MDGIQVKDLEELKSEVNDVQSIVQIEEKELSLHMFTLMETLLKTWEDQEIGLTDKIIKLENKKSEG